MIWSLAGLYQASGLVVRWNWLVSFVRGHLDAVSRKVLLVLVIPDLTVLDHLEQAQ